MNMQKPSKHQKFAMETISREDLKGADYNPRRITPRAMKALKASLNKYGLVQPIIWNKRTGNVVGGHQRLEALDAMHRGKPYALDVAVLDVDEKEEVALNVALNNQSAMGEFDFDAIRDLGEAFDLDMATDFLFDRDDLLTLGGEDLDAHNTHVRDANKDEALMKEIKDRKKLVRERAKLENEDGLAGYSDVEDSEFTLTLIFNTPKDKKELLSALGLPHDTNLMPSYDLIEHFRSENGK